jgi:hypothetical protein
MFMTKSILLALTIAGMAVAPASAPADASAKPAQDIRAQYEFLIGDWDVAVSLKQPGGKELNYHASWHNHWLANGQVLLQEWNGPYATGLELRSYVAQQNLWQGRNIYLPNPGTWYENTAKREGDKMIVTTHRADPEGKAIVSREIYMGPGHFSIRTEMSNDGEKTWQPGRYQAVMTRLKAD